jgi:hypothetical protein
VWCRTVHGKPPHLVNHCLVNLVVVFRLVSVATLVNSRYEGNFVGLFVLSAFG